MKRNGWVQTDRGSGGGKGAEWTHASGWIVQHCGHPTANWPYSLAGREHACVVSFNGLGFQNLLAAMQVVEGIVSGELKVTRENCVEGVSRVANATAGGEKLGRSA